ncbi:hypothetical protein SAMN05216251_108209 [Actinacidiphila alni]|uniref:Uncharacterized protein n=1 Tax=Actinacidiphila alni TaxID=380248 RepID=A0A1I2G2E6_9ACTN|nr:hypothetical protein [Actinacidiphila alni]SFF11299.1 hypothetical protein SAMN05216251_108209 [Actinacidiphila alni]
MAAELPARGTPEYRWWMAGAEAEAAARKEGRSKAGLAVRDLVDGLAEHQPDMTEADIAALVAYVFGATETPIPTQQNGFAMSSIGLPPVTTVVKDARTYAVDLAERVASTFVVATGGVLITATTDTVGHLSFWQSVAAGGVAAAGSLVKGILARAFGTKDSASLAKGV